MSSAVTHMGKLPKKTVKLIQLAAFTPWLQICLVAVQEAGNLSSCLLDNNRPICTVQCYSALISLHLRLFMFPEVNHCRLWRVLSHSRSGPTSTTRHGHAS